VEGNTRGLGWQVSFPPSGSLGVGRFGVGRLLVMAIVTALVASACTAPPPEPRPRPPAAPRIEPPLHTAGEHIIDRNGQSVRLLSIGIHGMEIGNGLPSAEERARTGCSGWRAPEPDTYANVERFGFNAVRLAISWANLEALPPLGRTEIGLSHRWNGQYLAALDAAVRGFTGRGIAVVLDMHQLKWSPAFQSIPSGEDSVYCQGAGMPAWLYPDAARESVQSAKCDFLANRTDAAAPLASVQDGFAQVWRMIASRYASDPLVIGADILNEPYYNNQCVPPNFPLDDFYARMGAVIRTANPKLLLILEDSQFDGSGGFALTKRPPFADAVYSNHVYGSSWEPDARQKVQTFKARAAEFDMPGWIGEFNRFGKPTPAPPDWERQLEAMMSFCKANRISWSYWAYSGSDPIVGADGTNIELLRVLQYGF
jgi:hypothetical protein